jgi:hypothetical protein
MRSALTMSKGNFNTFNQYIGRFDGLSQDEIESKVTELIKVKTEQWSGVRERDFKIDENLSFLKNPNPKDALFPLDFIRQVVFVPVSADDKSEEVDENPWEFPLLKKSGIIMQAVNAGATSNPKDKLLLERMKSFTQAQRIFRLAFDGNLGHNFPVAKLHQLSKLTKNAVKVVETPTWNVNIPVEYENLYIGRLSEKAQDSYKKLVKAQNIRSPKNLKPCN